MSDEAHNRLPFRVRRATAVGVAERWRNQYQLRDDSWKETSGRDAEQTWHHLEALGARPSIDSVESIIGNRTWTRMMCDGCSEYVLEVVEIPRFTDIHDDRVYCRNCLNTAASLLEAGGAP